MKTERIKLFLVAISIPILFTTLLSLLYTTTHWVIPFSYSKYWYGIIGTLCAFVAVLIVRKLDDKPLKNFTLKLNKSVIPNFLRGLVLGAVIAAVLIGSQVWYSDLSLTFNPENVARFMMMVLCILPLALMEELAFRSYAFFKLEKEFGIWTAQIATAILFAIYHVAGGWSIANAFLGTGVWALAFGIMAATSRGVSLPTGFHSGLNLVLALIGDKDWIPALWTVDFASYPTEEMKQSNTNFGLELQVSSLVVLILITWRYSKSKRIKKQRND